MSYIESAKTYTGNDLETIFFRPMLCGQSAVDLGIRVLYNMPVPTTIQLWSGNKNVLQKFTEAGWSGGKPATKQQKTIALNRVKAEMGFSAADYFSLVYELITNRPDVNMGDLTGTELEQAETQLFKESIAEAIRATMWVGDTSRADGYNTFNGFLPSLMKAVKESVIKDNSYSDDEMKSGEDAIAVIEHLWESAPETLRDMKGDGQLVFFATSDICHLYEKHLDSIGVDTAYVDYQNGRPVLSYHGIPIVDTRIGSYLAGTSLPQSFCFLTDRRNLVLAVNTSDFPGTEVRMWYNPDEMENRQRAVFMAGCEVLDHSLVTLAYKED